MTLQELDYFYDLAQTLNYSITAERLFVTQPVVSRHIQLLEDDLGFKLIDRTIRRKIRLTEAGELLFSCLKKCRSSWENTIHQIREKQEILQISFYLPDDQILPKDLLTKFDMFQRSSQKNSPTFKMLEKGQIKDILSSGGFVIIPDYIDIAGNYDSCRIHTDTEDKLMLISSAYHPAAGRDLRAYAGSPLFLPDYLSRSASAYIHRIYVSTFGTAPEIVTLDSAGTLMMYLMADIGVTINTSWYAWLNDPRITAVPLQRPVSYRILWDPEFSHPAKVLSFARGLSVPGSGLSKAEQPVDRGTRCGKGN